MLDLVALVFFQGICLSKLFVDTVVDNILYYILNVCRVFSDSPSFSPHLGNFDFLSNIFFLISLAKDFQSLLII